MCFESFLLWWRFQAISTIFSTSVFPLNRRNGLNTSDKLLYFISYSDVTATFKALHHDQWPNYLRLEYYQPRKPGLRSKNKYFIEQNCVTNTCEQTAAKLFNSLSLPLRGEENFKTFYNGTKKHFLERAKERIERDGK